MQKIFPEQAVVAITLSSFLPDAVITVDGEPKGEAPKVLEFAHGSYTIDMTTGDQTASKLIVVGTTEPTGKIGDNTWVER